MSCNQTTNCCEAGIDFSSEVESEVSQQNKILHAVNDVEGHEKALLGECVTYAYMHHLLNCEGHYVEFFKGNRALSEGARRYLLGLRTLPKLQLLDDQVSRKVNKLLNPCITENELDAIIESLCEICAIQEGLLPDCDQCFIFHEIIGIVNHIKKFGCVQPERDTFQHESVEKDPVEAKVF